MNEKQFLISQYTERLLGLQKIYAYVKLKHIKTEIDRLQLQIHKLRIQN